jgi:hypothetical protein
MMLTLFSGIPSTQSVPLGRSAAISESQGRSAAAVVRIKSSELAAVAIPAASLRSMKRFAPNRRASSAFDFDVENAVTSHPRARPN